MSKKDCIKKAEELLKGKPGANEVLAASYYYTAAKEYELARECFVIYSKLTKSTRKFKSIVNSLFVHDNFILFYKNVFFKNTKITDEMLLKRKFDKISTILNLAIYDAWLEETPKTILDTYIIYIQKGLFSIINARKLLWK